MLQLHIRQQVLAQLAEGGGWNYKAHNQNLVGGGRRGYEGCNSKVQNLHCAEGYERMCNSPLQSRTMGGGREVATNTFCLRVCKSIGRNLCCFGGGKVGCNATL
jgi:hypothetical protein